MNRPAAHVIQLPQPAKGTQIAIIGQHGKLVLLSAPDPDGCRRTVHGRAPTGVSLNALRRAARRAW